MLPKAATVLLMREAEGGFEVYMVKRPAQAKGFSGALVFPGGRLDEGDACTGVLAEHCRRPEGVSDEDMAHRICGIRETFEEAGVLLARARGSETLITGDRAHAIARTHRKRLHSGESSLLQIAEIEDLELACDLLVPFAHWITPQGRPRRFDTWFYLVRAPADQVAAHDDVELVDSTWASPLRIVEEADAGKWVLVFVTRFNLMKLAESSSIGDALERARASRIVAIEPTVTKVEGGAIFRIPPDAGYATIERFEANPNQ